MKKISLALLLPLLGSPVFAADNPWYAGVSLGTNWLSNDDISRTTFGPAGPRTNSDIEPDFNRRSSYSAVVGYRISDAWSIEGEYAYRNNKTNHVTTASFADWDFDTVGLRSNSVMANARYTFAGLGPLRPYVGAGVGASQFRMKWSRVSPGGGTLGSISDDNWAFAYQALVGMELELAKRWMLSAQYQYFRVDNPDVSTNRRLTAISTQTWEVNDYKAQTLSVGLRYAF